MSSQNSKGSSDCDPFSNESERDGIELIDLTGDDVFCHDDLQKALRVNKSLRNYVLDEDYRFLQQITIDKSIYEVGHFVEFREPMRGYDIEFIEITSIHFHEKTEDYIIRGLPYARTRNLDGRLPRKQNEVCLVLEIDAGDGRPDEQQALREISPEDILRRRILTKTNKSFPHCRFDKMAYATTRQREEQAPLCCRWKMRAVYSDASKRRMGHIRGLAVEHLSERDSCKVKRRNLGVDKERSREWRGETIPGGSTFSEPEPNRDDHQGQDIKPARARRYALADVSAGAGGVSRGAQMAGLAVVLASEGSKHSCSSYQANFPEIELSQMETSQFASGGAQRPVDILWISSSALAEAGDDPGAASKVCENLLRKFLPRFVIMDQPPTITGERNASFLNTIILCFAELGYSCQCDAVQMAEYGLPQMRKRSILICAGPGETLPPWPTATHSAGPTGDQKPLVTERDAISGLTPTLHSLHNPGDMPVLSREVRDGDGPINTVINANGSIQSHPDGERDFTLRELACFQGFPTYHCFEGSYVKKQIGHAFPPVVAMAFCQHLRQHMEDVDGVQHTQAEPVGGGDNSASSPGPSNEALIDGQSRTPTDQVAPGRTRHVPSNESCTRTPSRQQIELPTRAAGPQRSAGAALPSPFQMSPTTPSTRLTMSPGAWSNAEAERSSSASLTPPPLCALPTTSNGERVPAGGPAEEFKLKRERDEFEDPGYNGGDDDGDDEGGPLTVQTPSKRPRLSRPMGAEKPSRERSRAVSASMGGAAGGAEDGGADGREGSSPDDELAGILGRDLWDLAQHCSGNSDGEV